MGSTDESSRVEMADNDDKGKKIIDVTKVGPVERNAFIENLIKHIENDNLRLLEKIRDRLDK